jgi:hypothetical protein
VLSRATRRPDAQRLLERVGAARRAGRTGVVVDLGRAPADARPALAAFVAAVRDTLRAGAPAGAPARVVAATVAAAFGDRRTPGERPADRLAAFGGSWTFILNLKAELEIRRLHERPDGIEAPLAAHAALVRPAPPG